MGSWEVRAEIEEVSVNVMVKLKHRRNEGEE